MAERERNQARGDAALSRAEFSRATRRDALRRSGQLCEASGPRYGLADGVRCNLPLAKGVEFDHDVPDQLGGDNSLENCRAICVACHKAKTRGDVRQIRKADRQRDKHSGAWKKSTYRWPKRPMRGLRQQEASNE